jgi:hypothetical protein
MEVMKGEFGTDCIHQKIIQFLKIAGQDPAVLQARWGLGGPFPFLLHFTLTLIDTDYFLSTDLWMHAKREKPSCRGSSRQIMGPARKYAL